MLQARVPVEANALLLGYTPLRVVHKVTMNAMTRKKGIEKRKSLNCTGEIKRIG